MTMTSMMIISVTAVVVLLVVLAVVIVVITATTYTFKILTNTTKNISFTPMENKTWWKREPDGTEWPEI